MNALPTTTAGAPTPAATNVPTTDTTIDPREPAAVDARLGHLFRASLKSGRIHPLYLPILKYRNGRACP